MASLIKFLTKSAQTRNIIYASKQIRRNDSIFTKYREPPNGFFLNQKPLKPGEKREWEEWEAIWYVGWGAAILLAVVGGYLRPNEGILEWGKKEAEIRVAENDAAEAAAAESQ